MQCPECRIDLQIERSLSGALWQCPECQGVAANLAVLRKLLEQDVVLDFWKKARTSKPSDRPCPSCCQPLHGFSYPLDQNAITLDICKRCQIIWFDKRKLEAFPVRPLPVDEQLSDPRLQQALAKLNMEKYIPDTERPAVYESLKAAVEVVFHILDLFML